MSRSSSPPSCFADELDDLMTAAVSPAVSADTPDTDTAAVSASQTNSDTIDITIPSSIGPMRNEIAYARHLARQNKLNATQRVLLDELAHVRHNIYFPLNFFNSVLGAAVNTRHNQLCPDVLCRE
jgi:hypothetical protein